MNDADRSNGPAGSRSGTERQSPPQVTGTDPRGRSIETSALLERLPGVAAWDMTVVESGRVTPSMQRLQLTADRLADLAHEPGQDLMVAVPDGPERHFRRRYTIRRLDPAAQRLELQIVVHGDGDGPGARWAAAARPGDRVEAIGPRGKVTVAPDAQWHLFAGDESALPATAAMVESLAAGATAVVVLEVPGPEDEQAIKTPQGCSVTVRWLHRGARAAGDDGALVDALSSVPLPAGLGQAYLAGELRTVAALRRVLLSAGLAADRISAKPYWRLGVANASHGEPPKEE
jgi:NADPH-dependent ferric siderophore reductase